MHLLMMVMAILAACGLRLLADPLVGSWTQRWQKSLFLFIFPPLLVLMTTVAVLFMGPFGSMLGLPASWFTYVFALGFVIMALILLLKLSYQGWLAGKKVSSYKDEMVEGVGVKIIEINFPYSAQIGFWRSQLVVSRGMLNSLDSEHLTAVLAHEKAHYEYHDTFWFFWLGWLRVLTGWLPKTQELWQELLMLREMRADNQASKIVDPLLLAESLLFIAQKMQSSPLTDFGSVCAAFSEAMERDRLSERIEALFTEVESKPHEWWAYWLCLTLIPLITIPFHY